MVNGTAESIEAAGRAIGLEEEETPRAGWLERLVTRRMRRSLEKARAKRKAGAYADVAPTERARTLVRWACAKAAITGTMSGLASTTAALVTAETEGVALVVALPSAIAAIAGEMAVRGVVHVDLACELAELFDVPIDDDKGLTRLFTLVFGRHDRDEKKKGDLGVAVLEEVTADERSDIVDRAGHFLVGESVLRNLVPIVGIVSSAVTNVVVTYRLGHTLRRTFRYERAMLDALQAADASCGSVMDLLVEGIWFVFSADGRLTAEEMACLAERLDDLAPAAREAVLKRFTSDESDWLSRVSAVPEDLRDAFLNVLEVAAAVDKVVSLPETKILKRVAHAFGRDHDPKRIERMIASLDETGLIQ